MTKAGLETKSRRSVAKKTVSERKPDASAEWQETFNAVPDIIALISLDHEFIEINKAGCETLGRSAEDLKGKKCYEIVHGTDSPPEDCPCVLLRKTGKDTLGEISERGRTYVATASPIHDENRQIKAFAHTLKDITERKEAEEVLKRSQEDLERLVQERTHQLERANVTLIQEIEERKKIEESLNEARLELIEQKSALAQKNIALREILSQIEMEKRHLEEGLKSNVHDILLPLIQRLCLETSAGTTAEVLMHHLKGLTSSFGFKITDRFLGLTPREIEICSMIKSGLSNKEIGTLLHISRQTVEGHRKKIRKKMELSNSGINLGTYLKKM